jgi:hypothetical protein
MLPLLSGGWTYGRAEAAACARRITLLDLPIMEKPLRRVHTPPTAKNHNLNTLLQHQPISRLELVPSRDLQFICISEMPKFQHRFGSILLSMCCGMTAEH